LHPELPADFPPLRSLSLLSHNLPQRVTRFIGREKETAELKQMLARQSVSLPGDADIQAGSLSPTRLLTLTGPAGTGKTRLAVQVAGEVVARYPDGIWLAELASLTDAALLPPAVAEALQVWEGVGQPVLQTLVESLREKELLLILDSCDHVLEACAHLVDTLL